MLCIPSPRTKPRLFLFLGARLHFQFHHHGTVSCVVRICVMLLSALVWLRRVWRADCSQTPAVGKRLCVGTSKPAVCYRRIGGLYWVDPGSLGIIHHLHLRGFGRFLERPNSVQASSCV